MAPFVPLRTLENKLLAAERQGPIVRLRLANPPANALSVELMQALLTEFQAMARDETVHVVVLAAAGKLFSAGHDLKQLQSHRSDEDGGKAFFERTFALCSEVMQAIVNLPAPVIAQVDGLATAAGCQLVASCDLVVASERATFGVNGIDVGLFCTTPAVALTRVISRKRAMEMLLTGEMIDSATARQLGLVNRVVPADCLENAVGELAFTIAAKAPVAVQLGKRAFYRQAGMGLADAYEYASLVMSQNLMTEAALEGIDAFLGRREAARHGE